MKNREGAPADALTIAYVARRHRTAEDGVHE